MVISNAPVLQHFTGKVFGFILLSGVFNTVLSDYLWARAVVLTSPAIATIGLSITVPLAMISDQLLGEKTANLLEIAGAIMVLIGFILVNIPYEMQNNIISETLIFLKIRKEIDRKEDDVTYNHIGE